MGEERVRRMVLREDQLSNGRITAELVHEADPQSRPVVHHRVVDTLANLERVGSITPVMRQAGEEFRRHFHYAGFERLRARPLAPMPTGDVAADLTLAQIAGRRRVHAALAVLGGLASPAGSAVWHVVGGEMSLREWALREGWGGRRVTDKTAAGIVIGALGALAVHFGFETQDGAEVARTRQSRSARNRDRP